MLRFKFHHCSPDMYMMKRFMGACLMGARAVSQERFARRVALLSPDRPASGCITFGIDMIDIETSGFALGIA